MYSYETRRPKPLRIDQSIGPDDSKIKIDSILTVSTLPTDSVMRARPAAHLLVRGDEIYFDDSFDDLAS